MFFSWARGEKPGGINQLISGGSPSTVATEKYDPEKLQAWELGSKNSGEFFGPLQFNISGFFQDYTDKQVTTQFVDDKTGFATPKVLNASGAEIWGTELEMLWQPDFLEGLTLNAAYTFLDAKYTKFTDNVTSLQRLAYAASAGRDCKLVYLAANPKDPNHPLEVPFNAATFPNSTDAQGNPVAISSVACQVDYSGAKLERTPKHSVAFGASYKYPLADTGLDLLAEANASWQSRRYLDQDNGVWFDPYWNVDARVGIIHPKYEIIAYVDNLFDDDAEALWLTYYRSIFNPARLKVKAMQTEMPKKYWRNLPEAALIKRDP